METIYGTFGYSLVKILIYLILIISSLGTIVIPTFLNEKMLKKSTKDSKKKFLKKAWNKLDSYGKLFLLCVIMSGISGFTISSIDSWETEYEANKHFSELFDIKLTYQDSLNSVRDSLRDEQSKKSITLLQDSVTLSNEILRSKSFEYLALENELKLANEQKINLEKELNSPVIDEVTNPLTGKNPELVYDSNGKQYIFWVNYTNIGKSNAEFPKSRFVMFDIKTFRPIDKTSGTYDDTTAFIPVGAISSKAVLKKVNLKKQYVLFDLEYKNHFGKKFNYIRVYLFDTSYLNKNVPIVPRTTSEKIKSIYLNLKKTKDL